MAIFLIVVILFLMLGSGAYWYINVDNNPLNRGPSTNYYSQNVDQPTGRNLGKTIIFLLIGILVLVAIFVATHLGYNFNS